MEMIIDQGITSDMVNSREGHQWQLCRYTRGWWDYFPPETMCKKCLSRMEWRATNKRNFEAVYNNYYFYMNMITVHENTIL